MHGSGAVQKTTAEPKHSDDTTCGVQESLAVRDDCISVGTVLARARVP